MYTGTVSKWKLKEGTNLLCVYSNSSIYDLGKIYTVKDRNYLTCNRVCCSRVGSKFILPNKVVKILYGVKNEY